MPPARPLGHIAALDGLRGLLFLVVLTAHLEPWPGVAGGQAAMDTFFALSGFLITALVAGEHQATRRVSLARFYLRRALRLLPALALLLAVWLAVVLVFGAAGWVSSVPGTSGPGAPVSARAGAEGVGWALAYLSNWASIFGWFRGYVPLGHLWSLAVEEQFYLLWAPALYLLLRMGRRWALPAISALGLLSLLEPLVLWQPGSGHDRILFGTDTRAGALLLGAVVGLLWSGGALDGLAGRIGSAALGGGTALLVLSGLGLDRGGSEAAWFLGLVADSVGSALVVAALVMRPRGRGARWLSGPVLAYVGRRSYGLYLWHYLFATWFNGLDLVGYPLTLLCSFLAAELSWRVVESPALALKARLTRRPAPVSEAVEARPGRVQVQAA